MNSHAAGSGGPIGLLGGTFDPIHCGHLRICVEALEALDLDHVRLMPLNVPGHRDPPLASVEARCAMLAVAAYPPLEVDLSEIERGGVSYTVDTLEHLRDRFPTRPLCMILGLDSYRTLPAWHRPAAILDLAHIVVAARPDVNAPALPGLDEIVGNAQSDDVGDIHNAVAGRVFFLDLPPMPIASSDLRRRRRSGRSIRYLVPDKVDDFIRERHLYE